MRRLTKVLLLSSLFLGVARPALAGDADAALKIVDKAIKAHGGQEGLTKTQRMARRDKGILTNEPDKPAFTNDMVLDVPERWRWSMVLETKMGKAQILMIINGDKGWAGTAEMGKERLKEMREEAYVLWLTSLVPLKKEGFTLSALPEAKVNDQPAKGVKVVHKGHTDVSLYFDKQSGLLIKVERQAREGGLTVAKEYFYSDHKAVDGVQLPTKYTEINDGKTIVEVSSITYKFLNEVDSNLFAKP